MLLLVAAGILLAPTRVSATFCGKCGILYFYHVPKTGGSSMDAFIHRIAKAEGMPYINFWGDDPSEHVQGSKPSYGSCHSRSFHLKPTVAQIGKYARTLHPQTNPARVYVHHHHGGPMLTDFLPTIMKWQQQLRSRGCNLWLTTVLREPKGRLVSALSYNHIPQKGWNAFLEGHQAPEVSYIVFNHLPCWGYRGFVEGAVTASGMEVQWKIDNNRTYLEEAIRILSHFDHVGITQEMQRSIVGPVLAATGSCTDVKFPHTNKAHHVTTISTINDDYIKLDTELMAWAEGNFHLLHAQNGTR